jgi:hypothetical protein
MYCLTCFVTSSANFTFVVVNVLSFLMMGCLEDKHITKHIYLVCNEFEHFHMHKVAKNPQLQAKICKLTFILVS